MVNGVGAVLGPLASSLLMSQFSTTAYWWSLAIPHGAISAYLIYRIIARDPIPVEDQSEYQPLPARSSPLATAIGRIRPRTRR